MTTATKTETAGPLAGKICGTAMWAANEYLRVHDLVADPEALNECVRTHCKAALPAALHDAREAYEAGMLHVSGQTFFASFALAGIEAAKEAGWPREVAAAPAKGVQR